VSALNLIFLAAARITAQSARQQTIRYVLIGALTALVLGFALTRFLDSAMSFGGWAAWVYATWLAVTLTVWGFSLVLPWLSSRRARPLSTTSSLGRTMLMVAAMVLLTALALSLRLLIGGEDWNGFVESTFVLIFWIGMTLCVYRLRPARANYSATVILGTLLASAFVYKAMQATEILWGRPLGSTDDEIALKFDEYGGGDASFQLAHHALGNRRGETCGDMCRILRSYTNIRDTHIRGGVRLVEPLTASQGERPNIFIFVIDSMRPDYLGAYNPQHVNYTPNLDELARDSFVFKNAYTQYAGTTLSEPAIWSGALLLHTHFPQPFDEVNSLRRLAGVDGYQVVASYDSVLRQLLSPSDDIVKLDQEKELWNQYEACSTVEQLESTLDQRKDPSRPVLFYAQPMNVHQFARNDVPSPTSQHWQGPNGLNPRITYEVHWVDACLGGFFSYLKKRGLYDKSIIVITSDHGDATGEFGRTSHSTSIWPEIMRVPLMIHLPQKMRENMVADDSRVSSLIDVTPTLYYLLGHRPVEVNPLYGRPLLAESRAELDHYPQRDLLLASDVRAVYGMLAQNGRYLYVTYDSPAQSYLFDLAVDPNAQHSILNAGLKQSYDQDIIEHLHQTASFYGYQPGVDSLLTAANH
jgi:Sulfatase